MRHALLLLLLTACSGGDPLVGLRATPSGRGPVVVWDSFAEPLPEVPFPNDVATRADLSSPTGRRLNISREAPTAFERRLRTLAGQLDGFGAFAPLSVRFAASGAGYPARLDLERIGATQRGDGDFADDVVLLIDVSPASPTYGKAMALDFANGNFPLALEEENQFFDNDPRVLASNLLFDTYEEDLDADGRFDRWEDTNQNGLLDSGEDTDGDGRLDPHEDTDGDGVFDHPNLWGTYAGDPGRLDRYADLIEHYDLEEDMLFFRPLLPLRERTTYAVVLTGDLVGVSGEPVRSPFNYVHHLQQTAALRPLVDDGLLARYGRDVNDVAFAWTFTTQSSTADLVALREGLNGFGKLSFLNTAYAPEVTHLAPMFGVEGPEQFRLPPAELITVLRLIFEEFSISGLDGNRVQPVIDSYAAVDYVVAGDYTSPNLIDAGADGAFDLDAGRGHLVHQAESRRFILVVPRAQYGTPPFPVVLYCHGYSSMKLEALAFAGVLAKYGVATFVIDAYGHGLPLDRELIVALVAGILGEPDASRILPFVEAITIDRARDLNGDLQPDVGGDYYTHDSFHTRDAIRQTVVDYLQASRVLRGFDGHRPWPFDLNGDGRGGDLAGDFNGDGVVDVGGPGVPYYTTGMSMGGINSTILGAVEPTVRAAAPVSPGGGLIEVGMRTDLGGVVKSVVLPIMGPMVISRPITRPPPEDDQIVELAWLVQDVNDDKIVPFAEVGRLEGNTVVDHLLPGDTLEVRNLMSGEVDRVVVNAARRARAHLPADKGDPVMVTLRRADGTLVKEVRSFELQVDFQGDVHLAGEPLLAIQQGLGMRRGSHDLRRLLGLAQTILDPADPINYAGHYAEPLAVQGEVAAAKSLLIVLTMGDMSVPISAGVALTRAAGLLDPLRVDPTYGVTQNQLLVDTHVSEAVEKLGYFVSDPCHYDGRNINFDIDDLSDGRHPDDLPRLGKIARPPECSGPTPPPSCSAVCVPLPPLRAVKRAGPSLQAMRLLALDAGGRHVIDLPDPNVPFDPSMFVLNQIGVLFRSRGSELSDHPCLAANDCASCAGDADCPAIPPPPVMAE